MNYYLPNGQVSDKDLKGWEQYGNKDKYWRHVIADPSVVFGGETRYLNPHTVGPKLLQTTLLIGHLESLNGIRKDNRLGYIESGKMNLTMIEDSFALVSLGDLLKYANMNLTEFFDSCLDLVDWPDEIIRDVLYQLAIPGRNALFNVLGSENISRTHKMEIIQKSV